MALYLAVPLLATWISALQRPIFNERYLIAAVQPSFFLLVAVAVLGWGSEMIWSTACDDGQVTSGTQSWMKAAGLGRSLCPSGMLRKEATQRPARAMISPA